MSDLEPQSATPQQVPPTFDSGMRHSPLWPQVNEVIRDEGYSPDQATDLIMSKVSDAAANLVRPAIADSMRPYQNNAQLTNVIVGLLKERDASIQLGFERTRKRQKWTLIVFSGFFTIWLTWQIIALFVIGSGF